MCDTTTGSDTENVCINKCSTPYAGSTECPTGQYCNSELMCEATCSTNSDCLVLNTVCQTNAGTYMGMCTLACTDGSNTDTNCAWGTDASLCNVITGVCGLSACTEASTCPPYDTCSTSSMCAAIACTDDDVTTTCPADEGLAGFYSCVNNVCAPCSTDDSCTTGF